jgi:hypothetical protein
MATKPPCECPSRSNSPGGGAGAALEVGDVVLPPIAAVVRNGRTAGSAWIEDDELEAIAQRAEVAERRAEVRPPA